MPFNSFPCTNLNDVNLDFLLRGFQSMKTTLDQIEGQLAALGPYQNVKEALEAMLASGELADLADQILAGVDSVTSNGDDKIMPKAQSDDLTLFSSSLVSMVPADIYALYDALGVFTKHIYGSDSFGNDLVYYTYDAPVYKNADAAIFPAYQQYNNGLPYLFIVSGVHGDEKGSVAATYLLFKEMFSNPSKYGSILNNVSMTIVPVVNPSGFIANTRRNGNNVNINRNFPFGWSTISDTDKGAAPLDQPESAFLASLTDTLHDEYKSGLFCCDMHQYHTTNTSDLLFWYNCSTYEVNYPTVRNNLLKTVGWLRRDILADYPILTPSINSDSFMEFRQISGTDGTFISYTFKKGCSGFLCESPQAIKGGAAYSVSALDVSCRIVFNSLWSTLSQFFPVPQEAVKNLSEIGMTASNTMEEVLAALPYRATLDCSLDPGTTLHDSISTILGGIHLHITSLTEDGKRTLQAFSMDNAGSDTVMLVNTARNNQIVNKWINPVTPSIQRMGGSTPTVVTLQSVQEWAELFPIQIRYATAGGDLNIPKEGLLLVFHVQTTQYYDWIYLVNIGGAQISYVAIRPTTTTVPAWVSVSLS